jgi:hypothetical protein
MLENKKRVYRRWLKWPYGVVVILGALLIITAAACIFPLAPTQLSPPDGSVFGHFPRTTTLEWQPLIGAVAYRVEVDCFHCCGTGQWCTDIPGREWLVVDNHPATTYTWDWVGAQPGRWRVSGINGQGQEGSRSGWWGFEYTVAADE